MKLIRILNEKEMFSEIEQSIIDYMFLNSDKLIDLSIRDLADATYTSTASIFRLAQKCGLKGFSDFKIKFISEVSRTHILDDSKSNLKISDLDKPLKSKDSMADVIKKMSFLQIESIEETKNELKPSDLEEIVDLLDKSKSISFFGFDLNYYIAQSSIYNLLQIKKLGLCYETANSQLAKAMIMETDEVAILISRTGENKRLIQFAKILRSRNVPIVLLSTSKTSTLSSFADYFLYVSNTESYVDMGGIIFHIGCRYILDTIFAGIWVKNIHTTEEFIEQFEEINGGVNSKNRLW